MCVLSVFTFNRTAGLMTCMQNGHDKFVFSPDITVVDVGQSTS